MKLIDMRLPKRKKGKGENTCGAIGYHEPKYPYGLEIHLEKEQVDKIAAARSLKAGDSVKIVASGKVTSVRMSERDDGKTDHSVNIQIESLNIPDKKNFSTAFKEAQE